MLQRGDRIPHFEVTTLSGARVSYATIWQQQHLLLLILPTTATDDEETYMRDFSAVATEVADTACVVTRDSIPGMTVPAAIVADKWGEVIHATTAASVGELPSPEDLLDWIEYTRSKCPECEGETK